MRSVSVLPVLGLLLVTLADAGITDRDLYEILGLSSGPDTPDSKIRAAYKKLSLELHPDLNPNQSEEEKERYKLVKEAHEVLSVRKKRKVYDMMGHEGLKQLAQQQQGGGHRHRSPFDGFFGGFGGGRDGPDRGPDISLTMRVTLDDIYNGAEHVVPITKQKLKSFEAVKKCMKCKAQPAKMQKVQIGPGMVMQQEVPPDCRRQCSATGAVARKEVEMEVNIEVGVPERHELLFELDADEYPDKLPGDVKFVVESAPHKLFKRRGDDLTMTMKISLLQALVGFEKEFKHMDDHTFIVEREDPTYHGFVMTIEGEGMPKHHVPSEKGNLIVTFEVVFPQKITPEQAEQFRQILK
ncbi:DnaJ protein ERDJ3B [Diplonema papillatum]|nr:DnaJ protein ERDJ3B [Diplonema papillatum]